MHPFWHPLSTILLLDPPCFATPQLLKLLLGAGPVTLRYAGDRMWPAVRHGTTFQVGPSLAAPVEGDLVVVAPDGVPDLLRVVGLDGDHLMLAADSDPADPQRQPREAVLATTDGAGLGTRPSRRVRRLRRSWLDLREAWLGRPDDSGADPAGTVRSKYDSQAPFYAGAGGQDLEPALLGRIRVRVPPGGRVLVLGSGSGKECFRLATEGWRVTGVDFAPAMVRVAREEATRRDLDVEFLAADLRELDPGLSAFDGILFTYDVYSFLPEADVRVDVLQRLRGALAPGGALFLSARRVRSTYQRFVLTLQWIAAPSRAPSRWGRSHTRWIGMDGRLRRSFVQVFSAARLADEIRRAGFSAGPWEGGHALLKPAPDIMRG